MYIFAFQNVEAQPAYQAQHFDFFFLRRKGALPPPTRTNVFCAMLDTRCGGMEAHRERERERGGRGEEERRRGRKERGGGGAEGGGGGKFIQG